MNYYQHLCRWLKQAGVYLGSERKQRALSNELVGDNLEVELAPFSFKLSNGGEELRGAAFALHPVSQRRLFSFWSRMKCKTDLIHVCSHICIR